MKKIALIIIATILAIFAKAQNIGINQPNPTNSLHITPINIGDHPLKVEGLQAFTVGDTSILVINPSTGLVKYMNASDLSSTLINGDLINNIADSLLSNSTFINNFGDSLFLNQSFTDSLTAHIYNYGDTLLYNSDFINNLRDSIDTDVDSITLTGTLLTVYENGANASVNLSSLSDNDGDPTNEHNTSVSLSGNTLNILDGGGTISIDLTPLINTAVSNAVPPGTVNAHAGSSVPSGYLICDGSAVSRTTYADLFGAIGTMYGNGNGSTTFNLPNYTGQFLRGVDNGQGTDLDAATRTDRGDGTTGDVVGTKQANQTLSHNHTVNPPATNSNTTGNHLHSINPPSTNTNTTGSHTHSIDPPNTATTTNGNHNHGSRTGGISTFNGTTYIPFDDNLAQSTTNANTAPPTNCGSPFNGQGTIGNFMGRLNSSCLAHTHTISSDGNHNHTVNIAAFNSSTTGNHSHSVNIGTFNSSTTGDHLHTTDIPQFNSGNNGGNETRPTNISVLWCIKF